jgi:trehalose synthase
LVPLASAVGLDAKWETIEGDEEFFRITKAMHNALQGDRNIALTPEMFEHYVEVNRRNAAQLDLEGEVVMIHDPQPLALIDSKREGKWVWRCHVDLSEPNITIWNKLASFAVKYDRSVFSMESYIPKHFGGRAIVDYPCIDPLSEKNMSLDPSQIYATLKKFDVKPDKPIIGQISRFDRWKNPLGVIDVYRKVKKIIPEVQLLLVGSFAADDPEAIEWYNKARDYAGTTPDIHMLTNNDGVEDLEVNAFQRSLAVALQLSLKEGFCLSVTEALWKGVPVVATRAGGIPLQVIDGMDGYLVNNTDEAAERVQRLIRTAWLSRQLGRMGMQHVRENFLITKRLREYLRMHIELVGLAPS